MTSADRLDALRPGDRPLRVVRSVAAALACVTAAAAGHHSAGGPLPVTAVLAAFTGSAAVAYLLSARRLTSSQLLGLLVLCQVCVHLGASTGEMTMGAGMIAAHLVATAVSLAAVSYGEAFVWTVAGRLALRIAPLLHIGTLVQSVRLLPPVTPTRTRHDVSLAHSRPLRGPPVSLV